jgi:arylformamidase
MSERWGTYMPDLPRDLMKGGLAISGIYDLAPLLHASFLNVDLRLDRLLVRRPGTVCIPPATAAALHTAVWGDESEQFKRQNRLIGSTWRDAFAADIPMPGCIHLTLLEQPVNPESTLFKGAMAMMRL